MQNKIDLSAYKGHTFESSSQLTPEFSIFARKYRAALARTLGLGYKEQSFSRGHFYCSAFFMNASSGKLVYVSCPDVRYTPDGWDNQILIRTAEHTKDYSGGQNNTGTLSTLQVIADRLTK